jgi:hypothetical protein
MKPLNIAFKRLLTSCVPNPKVPVEIHLHPNDISLARLAADLQGMEFEEFCALAIHKGVRDTGLRS